MNFKLKKDNKKFSMSIEVPAGEEVYGCVNLCSLDDKIELAMNEIEEIEAWYKINKIKKELIQFIQMK